VEHKIAALGIIAKVCRLLFVLCCFGAADNMGQRKNPSHPHCMSTFRTLRRLYYLKNLQWRELQTVRCSPGIRSRLMGVVLIDDPTRLHTDKRGKLGLSPIAVSRSTMAASNSSTTAPDETDLSEVHSPINDRDQDTVSSATKDLGRPAGGPGPQDLGYIFVVYKHLRPNGSHFQPRRPLPNVHQILNLLTCH
jgi:hypothetical protein